jgi:hypothetical protein
MLCHNFEGIYFQISELIYVVWLDNMKEYFSELINICVLYK